MMERSEETPEGYAEALAEASNRAAVRYPWPNDRYTPHATGAERRAYVAGYMDCWVTGRARPRRRRP